MTDMKLRDMKLTDQVSRHEIDGHENDGHEIGGQAIYLLKIGDGVADDAALVTVAVSVADDAVPVGWSYASSSSLSDESSRGGRAAVCAPTLWLTARLFSDLSKDERHSDRRYRVE